MTRGAFYHHFKSKDEVLEALMTQLFLEAELSSFDDILNNPKLNGLQRLRKIMMASLAQNISSDEIIAITNLYSSLMNNPRVFLEKFKADLEMAKFFEGIIAEGMADGSIKQGNAKLLSELMMLLINFWMFPNLYSLDAQDEMEQKGELVVKILEALGLDVIDDEMGELYEKVMMQIM